MVRFYWTGLLLALVGCQSQNPYAMFGPNRVPTPGTQPVPYYPPTTGAAPAAGAAGSISSSSRTSVSADTLAPIVNPSAASTDAADKEPIRIVENPQPAARTAASPARSGSTTPAAVTQPAPTNGKSSQTQRAASNVSAASYEQSAAPAAGQWKSR